jgi:hypothetical protein
MTNVELTGFRIVGAPWIRHLTPALSPIEAERETRRKTVFGF